jgi:hypothetical protein
VPQWIFEVERAYGYGLTSRPYAVEVTDLIDAQPAATNLEPSKLPIYENAPAEYFATVPSITSLTLVDNSPKPKDYFYTVPSVTGLLFADNNPKPKDYFDVTPSVTRLDFSITYEDQAFEGFEVTPSCTELTLI